MKLKQIVQMNIHRYVVKLVRAQTQIGRMILGDDCPVFIVPFQIWQLRELIQVGPSFWYKGDQITWRWTQKDWLSLSWCREFPTLLSMDDEWDAFAREFKAAEESHPLQPVEF